MNEAAIKKYVQPWQQILAFIARTQALHDWASPKYGMTARQRKKWRQLWQLAGQAPQSSPDPMDTEMDDPQRGVWAMTNMEKACLEFCIELLNQHHRSHEYESALFLGFASAATALLILGKRKRAPWEDEAEVSRIERCHQLATMDMEAATHGKSMLFMVPAFTAPGGTTIVMVPLVALRADMQRRCQQLGISCVAWESQQPPDAALIMLVTPESAVSPDFQTFLNWLQWMRRLDRIVINECHVVLNSQRDFWPQMA
ncbi:uncharacterized protein CDV56_100022 [Aspergillus thermomutatus]|uniref:Helicase ATP-binding domain-containing protein n=1 Tax=Aspergillus thermomutatus TaxID=41047 RepID=A0A397FWH0_ASPTH|nr:uncharacterized protein CDV56_100022 [Aspergillus thermomutatus]RHZ43035.1 hypothetical protein CDV56_100022 [Aspergillus thermomutatus]